MDVLLESAVRITVLIALVAVGLRALRVTAPRSAHRAWTGVCLMMLALPAVVAWAPRALVPILPARDTVAVESPVYQTDDPRASVLPLGRARRASRSVVV